MPTAFHDDVAFNSSIHSKSFNSIGNLLMPNEYDYEGRKVVLCYNPIDDIDHYSLVRYMKDEELDYINRRRKDAGYPVIKRLAHTKTGYVQCASQREKLNIEYEAEQGVDVKKLISDFEQIANKMVSSNWGRLK